MKLSQEHIYLCDSISYLNITILRINIIKKYCLTSKIITLLKNMLMILIQIYLMKRENRIKNKKKHYMEKKNGTK